jgi:hypothetical protein
MSDLEACVAQVAVEFVPAIKVDRKARDSAIRHGAIGMMLCATSVAKRAQQVERESGEPGTPIRGTTLSPEVVNV